MVERLNQLIQELERLPEEVVRTRLPLLQANRLKCSSTLKKEGLTGWILANQFIEDNINAGVLPNWRAICHLNELILQSTQSVRTTNIYLGHQSAVTIEQLDSEIKKFSLTTLTNSKNEPILNWISRCRYELVTIHPFINGNGRTAVLVCDWLLAFYGYLPLSFTSKVDNFVGRFSDNRRNATIDNAYLKLIRSLELSYMTVLGKEQL